MNHLLYPSEDAASAAALLSTVRHLMTCREIDICDDLIDGNDPDHDSADEASWPFQPGITGPSDIMTCREIDICEDLIDGNDPDHDSAAALLSTVRNLMTFKEIDICDKIIDGNDPSHDSADETSWPLFQAGRTGPSYRQIFDSLLIQFASKIANYKNALGVAP